MRVSSLIISVSFISFLTACGGGSKGGTKPPVNQSSATISSLATSLGTSSLSSSSLLSSAASISSAASSISSVASSVASVSELVVVDQFGYLPDAQKIAVLRDPQTGYDSAESFTPSASISLVDMTTGETLFSAAPVAWKAGATDTSSGDKAWWFDFSSVTTPGTYAVVDKTQNLRSPTFKIAADVYKPVLKHALRTFFYQRAGFAKELPYAEAAWADGASHIGAGQDKNARIYNDKSNAATEKDLSGGWYDAGDYNKYTTWAADYVITLLHAYLENPAAWTDDFNIPESNNGIPDILDEVKWGVDWLKKMQDATGDNSVLTIVGLASGSPPSAATGRSYYGTASTNATMSTAGAFALASKVFADVPAWASYATDLNVRAENAWAWAVANPSVTFFNNDEARQPGSGGLGAGQQEPIDWSNGMASTKDRAIKKRMAAIYLFAATGGATYKSHIEADYTNADLEIYSDPFHEMENTSLLYYSSLPGVTPSVASDIKTWFKNDMNGGTENWNAMTSKKDPYLAYIKDYVWGSNGNKASKGSMFTDVIEYEISGLDTTIAKNSALTYINYLHGVNPQGMVYLSNMYSLGAHSSANEFYHTWFGDGTAKWDRVGTSIYGPAPGFLTGGPNPSYDWDGFCTGSPNDSRCGGAAPNPPKGQPAQKAYKDFNTSWPLNSWSVTENSNGYQSNYLRLLSKFVN
ncbi:MAG: LacI family transcriptional regulator [Gammaproteobacteria bacterium]|nr:MAG: LacI family transcriptional regulator [Gammaproteobacteria bacterium]